MNAPYRFRLAQAASGWGEGRKSFIVDDMATFKVMGHVEGKPGSWRFTPLDTRELRPEQCRHYKTRLAAVQEGLKT